MRSPLLRLWRPGAERGGQHATRREGREEGTFSASRFCFDAEGAMVFVCLVMQVLLRDSSFR